MAEALPNRPSLRNGSALKNRVPHPEINGHGSPEAQGSGSKDSLLVKEGKHFREVNDDILEELGAELRPTPEEAAATSEWDELRQENAELRGAVQELRDMVEAAQPQDGKSWEEREKEFESLLEEKTDIIRDLHLKTKDLQEKVARVHVPVPHEEELQALCDELERERAELDADRKQMEQDRAQLREDEADLMKQMREMEMSMSRERAELARQRNELQRLHADIQHALELATRDASLRDRLGPLQRRHQDINSRKGGQPSQEPRPTATPAPATTQAAPAPKKESGLFGRLFGSGQ